MYLFASALALAEFVQDYHDAYGGKDDNLNTIQENVEALANSDKWRDELATSQDEEA